MMQQGMRMAFKHVTRTWEFKTTYNTWECARWLSVRTIVLGQFQDFNS